MPLPKPTPPAKRKPATSHLDPAVKISAAGASEDALPLNYEA